MTMNDSKNVRPFDVRGVAGLARIALADDEAAALQTQVEGILAWTRQWQEVDVKDVPPTESVADGETVWREDVPEAGLEREAALKNAPLSRQGQFVVPKVLE